MRGARVAPSGRRNAVYHPSAPMTTSTDAPTAGEWNSHYTLYAESQGRTPLAQWDADRAEWPSTGMVGFLRWIGARRREFYAQHPERFAWGSHGRPDAHVIQDVIAWDAFLAARALELAVERIAA